MSLRYQILFRILISSLCVLVLGGAIAIWQARQSVEREVQASIQLALQLITLGVADAPVFRQLDDLSHLRALKQTRHLSIQLQKTDGQLIQFTGDTQPNYPEDMPPAWFVHLVQEDYPKVEHQLKTQHDESLTLIIQAQPLDEIREVWQETVEFFATILLLALLTFLAVNLVFNKSLQSISVIVDALRGIESGQYQHKLPTFAVAEFDSIAKAVNHMTVELEKTRLENRDLTQHSLAIQEDERQRLSQELHDEFGQSLTAIKCMAVTAVHQNAEVGKISTAITEICDHLMLVVRSMMQQLHPLVLTELGLKATLEDMVNHWAERNPELHLIINCGDELDYMDKAISIQVFRVIQECLTNVMRHAQARQVQIDLCMEDGPPVLLQLRIEDDGQGCDLSKISRGFGLLGIKERIKSLNGEISFRSQPGCGMAIFAWVPVA
jgi:two-component system, NarL family, sensor histidine kinase UhpB